MAIVYANSALNISADDSSDGTQGLFRGRLVEDGFFRVLVQQHDASLPAFWFCASDWTNKIEFSPLAERAWVVQERFLAPRVVHFGKNQVYWECVERTTVESQPQDMPYMPDNAYALQKCEICDETPQNFSSSRLYASWCRLLWLYSKSKLTITSDRSMALAGLATAYVQLFGWQPSDYLYALWRPELVHFLPWRRRGYRHGPQRAYRAGEFPSWSWLSVAERVDVPHYNSSEGVAAIVSVEAPAAGSVGNTEHLPMISIRGPLCQLKLLLTDEPSIRGHEEEMKWLLTAGDMQLRQFEHIDLAMDYIEVSALPDAHDMEVFLLLLRTENISREQELWRVSWGEPKTSGSEPVNPGSQEPFLGPGYGTFKTDVQKPRYHDGNYECLVLQPTGVPGQFRRVGYVDIKGAMLVSLEKAARFETFSKMLVACNALDEQSHPPDIPPHLYHEVGENFHYTITQI